MNSVFAILDGTILRMCKHHNSDYSVIQVMHSNRQNMIFIKRSKLVSFLQTPIFAAQGMRCIELWLFFPLAFVTLFSIKLYRFIFAFSCAKKLCNWRQTKYVGRFPIQFGKVNATNKLQDTFLGHTAIRNWIDCKKVTASNDAINLIFCSLTIIQ